MAEKTEYYVFAGHSHMRRVWKDEKGHYAVWRGEKSYLEPWEHYHGTVKHQDDVQKLVTSTDHKRDGKTE